MINIEKRLLAKIPALETLPQHLLDLLTNEIDLIIQEEVINILNQMHK